jgi:hypothetical protein
MNRFKRKSREIPVIPSEQIADAGETKLFPGRESKRLNETVTILDKMQQGFLDDCAQRGLDPQVASEAMLAAMREGAYPAVLSTRPRRDNVRVVSFVHGTPPEGLLKVVNGFNKFNVMLGERADGGEWPIEPDADDPNAFYLETHKVETDGRIPFYDDERDQKNAKTFRDLNTRLSSILPLQNRD